MATVKSKARYNVDESMLRAGWDAIADICCDYKVAFMWQMRPSTQRGVWIVRIRAYRQGSGPGAAPIASIECRYPSAHTESLSATLYRAINLIGQEIATRPDLKTE